MITGTLWSIALGTHLLCMAYWIGGGLVVWRSDLLSERSLSGVQSLSLRFQNYARYYRTLWHVMPLSALTGIALGIRLGEPLPAIYHLMTLCWIVMTALFCWVYFSPLRELKRALQMKPASLLRIRKATLLMIFVGIIATCAGAFRELI
ncbi:hypothetical protein FAI40_00545 [Acetobacteraceae bacterium]|nr:hypothetical protein FAI40_00545 [Acetobacteraceae bacterium]